MLNKPFFMKFYGKGGQGAKYVAKVVAKYAVENGLAKDFSMFYRYDSAIKDGRIEVDLILSEGRTFPLFTKRYNFVLVLDAYPEFVSADYAVIDSTIVDLISPQALKSFSHYEVVDFGLLNGFKSEAVINWFLPRLGVLLEGKRI